nr:helicase-related protein [Mycobacterium dioxanotrophicus]
MDIQGSAREDKALEITRGWVREHGRVLIFTQHTDTVVGLLRRMDAEGLQARSFHGSLSPSERAKTIAAFRSGEAPVMISTDAGAEGQNLQFCNCVLNFDLPWNPMRIEQRIGRVDRLTQPKDEVFVANLYARNTIDESVYQLLALKLRMFELLFGQVTTILGELDDSKSASFESRVMEALFADDDSKMHGLLTQLGTELAQARDRASTLIATDSNLSNWMAAAFEHRKDLTKAGSSELVPEVSERTRMRQRRVQTWTRKVLTALDARFLHDTGEGEGAFLTAEFDEEYAEELGGRTVMHLAFDRFGLDQHPDAELCAVGSPVFDELLGLLRMRGDMHATVPVIPDDIGPSPYRHAPTLRLIRRRLIPSGTWSGQATFRATIGEAETTEHLITADVNGHNEQRLARRPLQDGETLPSAFDIPSKVIANFEKAAASQLEALRSERAKQVEEDQKRELARISAGYTAQIDEAGGDDRARLRRALASEERRLNRRPDIRARAKLLALTLDEGDWLVEETWTGPSETERGLVYEWGLPAPIVESDVSGEAIKVLTLCSGAHWVDESEVNHCGSCDEYLCGACGDDAVFVNCPLCGTSTCGACRNNTGGLCRECASPERAPELDNEFAIAWRLRAGDTLLVGERVATLVRANGTSQTVVPDEDLDDRGRRRLRSYARQNGLPLDCGLVLRDLTGRTDDQNITRVRLRTTSTVNVELTIGSMTASAVDHSAVDFLPTPSPVGVEAERDFQVGGLLKKLRDEVPPPPPPTVMVTRRSTFTDVYLEADRLVEETSTKNDGGSIKVESERIAEFQWREPSITSPLLAEAQLGQVRVALQRRNEAVLVEAHVLSHAAAPKRWAACSAGYSIADQLGCYDFLRSFGAPGGRLGMRTDGMLSIDEPFPAPTECHLVNRSIRQIAELIELESDQPLVSVDTGTLATLGVRPNKAAAQGVSALPDELNRALLSRAARPFTTAVIRGLEITEVWQGHGRATHVYKTFDGEPLLPKLDDIGFREKNFGVCRDGHFYAAGAAAFCGACQSWACRACDEIDNQISLTCPECSTSVCRRCLWTNHEVPNDRCLLCDDHACPDCGRDPQVVPCSMCCRATCESCRAGDACPACGQLVTADQSQIDELPKELALTGATVLIGADDNATVVVLNRGRAFEQAIVRDGAIHRWVAFDRGTIDNSYRLRLLASGSFEKQVVPIVQWLKAESTIDGPHLVVLSERKYHRTWSIAGDPTVRRSVSPSDTPSADLTLLTLDDFPAPTQMMPDAVEAAPPALVPILRSMAEPTTAAMTISWERSGYDLAVTPEGIADLTFQPTIDKESMAPWTDADEVPLWVIDAWDPTPSVHVYSKVRDVESVIVELASMLALGVRTADRSVWYAINASDKAPVATMLSRWLGLGDADEVGVFTDPRKLKLSHVTNANRSSVSIEPLGALHAGPQTHAGSAVEALAAWIPTAKVKAPQFQPLPPNLHSALRQSMSPLTPRSTLEIGADVEHVVTVDDGSEWRYERKLAAGQLDARRIDSITGHLLDSGVLDREGHFGVDCSTCNYCGGRTCRVCVEGLVLCTCCKTPICGRCTRSVHGILSLCPACVETRPPTRSEARQHGRFLLTRRMLIGTDAHHTVVLEKTKDEWTLHWPDGTKRPIADTSAMQFLDEQLANSGSRS